MTSMHPGQYPPQPQPGQYPPNYGYQQPQATPQAMPPVAGNPRVQEALSQVDLLAGEQVVYTLQADGFFLGALPILKMIAALQAFILTVTGGHIRIFLVVTNQRLLVIKSMGAFCGMSRVKSVHTIALAGVKEVGSAKETHMCCVNTRTVQVQSLTQRFNLVIKKLGDQEIRHFVTNLSAVIVAQTNRASV